MRVRKLEIEYGRPDGEIIRFAVPALLAFHLAKGLATQRQGTVTLLARTAVVEFNHDGSCRVIWNQRSDTPWRVDTYDSRTTVCV